MEDGLPLSHYNISVRKAPAEQPIVHLVLRLRGC